MTTIILTIIGILLAAAAALMVIFYGGDAFNSGSIGAQANTIQNAGTNLISATQMYKAETANTPADLAALGEDNGSGKYLDETPALPKGLALSMTGGVTEVTGVPAQVCARINKNLKLATAPANVAAVQKMGCVTGTDPLVDAGVFYAKA